MTKRITIVAFGAVLVLGAAVLVAIALGLLDDDGGGSGPELAEPECVDVEIPSTLQSNTEFEVSYRLAADPGPDCPEVSDPLHIRPPSALFLWQGDEKLNTLGTGSNPYVEPPDNADIDLALHAGPGPYRFLLPELSDGTYVLCGSVSVAPEPDDIAGKPEPLCRQVTVRA